MNLLKPSINLRRRTRTKIPKTPIQTLTRCLQIIVCYQLISRRRFQWITSRKSFIAWASFRLWTSTSWSSRPKRSRMFGTYSIDQKETTQMRYLPSHSLTSCASWWIWTIWWLCQILLLSREIASLAIAIKTTKNPRSEKISIHMVTLSTTFSMWYLAAKLTALAVKNSLFKTSTTS